MFFRKLAFTALCLLLCPSMWAQVYLGYKHYDGLKYHIIAQVDEQVFHNHKLVYSTQILNRIAIQVVAIVGQNALLDVHYQISEEAENGRFFSWTDEREAQFEMSPQGLYENLDPLAKLPSLRHVPSFPDHKLKAGEGWNAPGTEIQDLTQVFGIPAQLRFDFTVNYMYRGEEIFQGRKLKHITLFYNINQDVSKQLPQYLLRRQHNDEQPDIPRSMRAQHNIDLYWDSNRGLPVFQKEDFEISYLLRSGDEVQFRGRSRGNIIEAEPMRHQYLKQALEKDLQEAGIDAKVQPDDKGISISIDSINFYPNSDRMLPGEEYKLQRISNILKKYSERDILVTGHTADLGQPEQQQRLSERRSAAVGQYLIENKVRRREQIVIRGVGGTQPIASNSTERGRKQNRRVEITLLEN